MYWLNEVDNHILEAPLLIYGVSAAAMRALHTKTVTTSLTEGDEFSGFREAITPVQVSNFGYLFVKRGNRCSLTCNP